MAANEIPLSAASGHSEVFQLLALPDTVFEQMLGFFSFHEVALLRRVSKKFNETCMRMLNQGFRSAEKFHAKCLKVSELLTLEPTNTLSAPLNNAMTYPAFRR